MGGFSGDARHLSPRIAASPSVGSPLKPGPLMNGVLIQARHALEAVVKRVHREGMGVSSLPLQIGRTDVRDQGQEELEPGSVGGSGVELESSGKQCCLIKALKALSLAFSRLSCSISLSSCFILSSCCILRCS